MKNKLLIHGRLIVIFIIVLLIGVQVGFSKIMDENIKVRLEKNNQTADKSPSYTTRLLGGKRNADILRKFRFLLSKECFIKDYPYGLSIR